MATASQMDPNQIPGRPQLWNVTGSGTWLAYVIPGTMQNIVWMVEDQEQLEAWYGTRTPQADLTLSYDEFIKSSPWQAGLASEIQQTDENPWTQFMSDFNESAQLRPWLKDPQMLAVLATSYMEGRTPTTDELNRTDWWQNHSAAERKWMEETATIGRSEQWHRFAEEERRIQGEMQKLGLTEVPWQVTNFITHRSLTGEWQPGYVAQQILKLADPAAPGDLNPWVNQLVKNENKGAMTQTRREEDTVRELARTWLGPVAGNLSQADTERWAGRMRNDPDAKIEFEEHLRRQRKALFPTYTDESLTYEDIVTPVRNLATNVWGQPVKDETMLIDLANTGDFTEMQRRLRKAGLNQNISKVVNDAVGSLGETPVSERVVQSAI